MSRQPIASSRPYGQQAACLLGLLLALLLCLHVVAAPNEDAIFGVDDTKRVGKGEPTPGDGIEGLSLPYSQILRDTEPPYENVFRDVRAGGRFYEKVGPADAHLKADLLSGPRMNLPLASRGVRPEDAEFKLGQFYLDINALSLSLLYTDNKDLSEDDRDDGVIGIVRLTSTIQYQIADSVRLAVRGTLIYLPFQNEIGIAGFGVDDPLFEFEAAPLFQTQLTLDQKVGEWDVEFIDEVRIRHRRFDAGSGLDAFDGEQFDEEDRTGRYVFRDHTAPAAGGGEGDRESRLGYNFIEGRNLVGASAGRLLPTVTRLEFGGYHADYWYTDTNDRRLPGSRDTVYASLVSQREELRFKPFARFRATHYDTDAGWREEARVGAQGPVTENLNAYGDVGYYWRTDSSRSTYLVRGRLRHSFNPLTYHEIDYYRGVTEPIEEIANSATYRLHHIFRSDLSGRIYGSFTRYENAGTGHAEGDEFRAAARVNYDLAQHTSLRLSGAYAEFHNQDPLASDFHEWIGRSEIFYRHTTSLQTRLIYQYRDRTSETPGQSYWENLVALTLIKYF